MGDANGKVVGTPGEGARLRIAQVAALLTAPLVILFCMLPKPGVEVWWTRPTGILIGAIFCLPLVAVFTPDRMRRNAAFAAALIGVFAATIFSLLIVIVFTGFSPGAGGADMLLAAMIILVPVTVLFIFWIVQWAKSIKSDPGYILPTVLWAIFAGVLMLVLVGAFFSPYRPGGQQVVLPERDMIKIDGCAWLYKGEQGKFPEGLAEISTWNPACLGDLESGRHGRLRYEYSSRSDSFELLARPQVSRLIANHSPLDWKSDQSGLIWDRAKGDRLVPTFVGPRYYRSYLECLRRAGLTDQTTLHNVLLENNCLQTGDVLDSDNSIRGFGARIQFALGDAQHKFILEMRPDRYGEETIRSYVSDGSGVIHATPENRPARFTDPPADPKEFE